jgi:hypothetical protein
MPRFESFATSGRPGRSLGGFIAITATIALGAAVADIIDQGGAWWHYAIVMGLWLALSAFALLLIPAVLNRLMQRIVRARVAGREALQSGTPVEPFLQRTVPPESGIRLPQVLLGLAVCFALISSVLGMVGAGIAASRFAFLTRAANTEGLVIRLDPETPRPGEPQRPAYPLHAVGWHSGRNYRFNRRVSAPLCAGPARAGRLRPERQ